MRCRTGALAQAARGKPSLERDFLTMDPEAAIRSRQRASGGESRTVYASTFVAGCWLARVALKAKAGRANKVAGDGHGEH